MASAVPLPNPFKRKRAALPPLPTDQVSRSAAAAAADDNDEEERHLAEALPPSSAKPSGAITALSQMPAARRADARTAKALDLQRSSNREAFLAQCVGAVQIAPCKSCLKGQGPWNGCVAVAGFLVGSCANCHYGGEGRRCSFRSCKFIHFQVSFYFSDTFRMFFGCKDLKTTRNSKIMFKTLNKC
jgi:hypothetical protein